MLFADPHLGLVAIAVSCKNVHVCCIHSSSYKVRTCTFVTVMIQMDGSTNMFHIVIYMMLCLGLQHTFVNSIIYYADHH